MGNRLAYANLPGKINPFLRVIFPIKDLFLSNEKNIYFRSNLKKFLIVCMAQTGCASTTVIVPTRKDTFTISREDNSPAASLGTMKAATFKDFGAHCAGQGKNVNAISETNTPRSFGQFPQTTLHFTCI